MIHFIFHGYFPIQTHNAAKDFSKPSPYLKMKPHTDYALETVGGFLRVVDLTGDPAPDGYLFLDKDIRLAEALSTIAPVFNSPKAIALADDKIETYRELSGVVPLIDTVFGPFHYRSEFPKEDFLHYIETLFGYPMVVKAAKGSFGEQVHLAKDREQLISIIKNMGSEDFLVQPLIQEACGVDKRVIIIGDDIVGAIERKNPYDFRANIATGGSAKEITLSEDEKAIALAAHKQLGLDFSGIDLITSHAGPLLVEVNSNFHYEGFKAATGIDISRRLLMYALEKTNP